MKKIYYLSTCSTCSRILKELKSAGINLKSIDLIDIKANPLNEQQIDELKEMSGSYLDLFSKRAMKYKALGLAGKNLTEADYKHYLLQDYTFLKRPVALIDEQIFIGNSKKVVAELIQYLTSK